MIITYNQKTPVIGKDVFIAEGAHIIGDVEIGAESSVWYNTVIRGDVNIIRIGKKTNVQDLSVIHVTNDLGPHPSQIFIGDGVTIGHRALLHGCRIGDNTLIGMGSILMDHVEVGKNCIIAAGSLLLEGTQVPDGHLAMGQPARIKRAVTAEEVVLLKEMAAHYGAVAQKSHLCLRYNLLPTSPEPT